MGRNLTGCVLVLLVTLGVAAQPAQAKDQKRGAARDREALVDTVAAREARPVSMRYEAVAASAARPAASSSATAEMSSSGRNGKPHAPIAEQPEIRSNPFRVNIGAVAVQPAIGGINGARFSIGF